MPDEREIAARTINEWNDIHAIDELVVFLPVRWETHAIPQTNVRPQDAINRDLLAKCDVLLGMFWTKIGTKTGVAESGTVEEVNEFVQADKPTLLYFSSRPIDPNKIDLKQHRRLQLFKHETYQFALVGSFVDSADLQQKLLRDLTVQARKLRGKYPFRSDRLERALRTTELLRLHRKENISPKEFSEFQRSVLGGPSRRLKSAPTPIKPGETGPSGFPVTFNRKGDKVELWPDEENPGKTFEVVIHRNDGAINEARAEFWDKVWWNRHQNWLYALETGQETLGESQRTIFLQARLAARKIEAKYGKDNLGWDDFYWGMINGKLSALNWVMGDEWDFLDT
jgi:hypothetical protein